MFLKKEKNCNNWDVTHWEIEREFKNKGNGVGITQTNREKILTEFFDWQERKESKRKRLVICQSFLKTIQWNLKREGKEKKGKLEEKS